jgi:diphthine-ammonia ligase
LASTLLLMMQPPTASPPVLSRDRPMTDAARAAERAICSWSGGKDSALALEVAIESGIRVVSLLTMLEETGERSRSHGLPRAILAEQAAALELPLFTRAATWSDYTQAFVDGLNESARPGCESCIFGDIDVAGHRVWCEEVCATADLVARHPLWQWDRHELLEHLLERGWTAVIVVVRESVLDPSFLGRRLDRKAIDDLDACGIDVCGENGEFHTVVTNGPLFAQPLELSVQGEFRVGGCLGLRLASHAS